MTAPNEANAEDTVGFQDRIARALTRKNSRSNQAVNDPRQVTQIPIAASQYSDSSAPSQRIARPNMVRQASLQEPIRDPFGDQAYSATQPLVQQRYPAAAPPQIAPAPARAKTKQASILSLYGSQDETPTLPGATPRPVDLGGQAASQDNAFAPGSDFNSRSNAPDSVAPPQRDPATSLNQSEPQTDSTPPENLRNRLDSLMEETENELRDRQTPGNEPQDQPNADDKQPGTRSLLDLDDEATNDDNEKTKKSTPLNKPCEEFRNELLDNPIRNIALDMSAPPSDVKSEYNAISRSWTDRSGNVVATGAMADLRRGYVILDNGQKIAFARLSDADLAAVADFWKIPSACSVGNRGSAYRSWNPQTFSWTASSLCHKPLYFENIQLERYGHSHGPFIQPVQSVAHFFVSLATLPYQTSIHPANECEYALGLYRPGDCAPWLKDPFPISLDGLRRQSLITTGLILIP